MPKILWAAALFIPQLALAASMTGILVHGGGIDDMFINVRDAKGKQIHAYCQEKCGDIFGEPDRNEVVNLKRAYRKRKVKLEYTVEMNHDRIVGPGEERLEFVRKLEFLR